MESTGRRLAAAAMVALGAAALAGRGAVTTVAAAKDSKADLQKALRDEGISPRWIYDDIEAGFARAAKEGKPLCIVFR